MKFGDIPMLTQSGQYQVNTPLDHLDRTITRFQDRDGESCSALNLLPDFQRGHVWTEAQQIAYVEFFLRGGMTGRTIYLNYPNWGHFSPIPEGQYREFVIVDGLQRLTALLRFVRGEIPAFGHYVNIPTAINSPVFEDRLRMARAGDNLIININNLKSRQEVLQWYLELNEGGTPHTSAELIKVKEMLAQEMAKNK